jgi:hypothetical protein
MDAIESLQSEVVVPDIPICVHTLISGGFILDEAQRKPGYILIVAHRVDEFGAVHHYCFAIAEDTLTETQVDAAKLAANYYNAELIVIGLCDVAIPTVDWVRFINLFGGPVISTSPLEPSFAEELIVLSYNKLPKDLQGKPDDLFEIYVQAALEFILGGRVVRYGQKRQFEARPDGIAIPSINFSALYDAKAYANGYTLTSNSIRQFKAYVEDFSHRYKNYLPQLNVFIVISSKFPHKPQTLESRSRELFSECHVPLSFLTSDSLAKIIKIISDYTQFRRSINWARIFADPIVRPENVEHEIEVITKDQVITGH